jgi:hypothetical protein
MAKENKAAEPELGIKETTEVLDAAFEITAFLMVRLKDGVGLDDGLALYNKIMNDPEFRDKVIAAWDNFAGVKDELVDLNIEEGLDIGIIALSGAKQIVKALKETPTE